MAVDGLLWAEYVAGRISSPYLSQPEQSALTNLKTIQESLRNATLAAYVEEYKEQTETWHNLESKAQGNIAVAGIFIAGSLAFLEKLGAQQLQQYEKVFLVIAIVCLIISVILAIFTLKTQTIDAPPLGSFVGHYTTRLLKLDAEAKLLVYLESFFNEHVSQWKVVMDQMREANAFKARYLWAAQRWLIAAILAVAALSLSRLLT
jgi:amino acid transporter